MIGGWRGGEGKRERESRMEEKEREEENFDPKREQIFFLFSLSKREQVNEIAVEFFPSPL